MCVFNPKSHKRRRRTQIPEADPIKQSYVLEGIFLILKHNTSQDIQTLIRLIRSNAQPKDIFSCIRSNLRSLQERELIEICEIDDDDFFALAPTTLLRGQTHTKPNPQEGHVKEVSPKSESWSTDLEAPSLGNEVMEGTISNKMNVLSPDQPSGWKNVPEHSVTYSDPNEFFEAMGLDDYELSAISPPAVPARDTIASQLMQGLETLPSMEQSFRFHTDNTGQVSASVPNPFTTLAMSTLTGLPVSPPESTLDRFTFAFINYAQQLLSTGTTLDELNVFGLPSCELLFRDRNSQDKFTIPNWACEVSVRTESTQRDIPGTKM